jgi:hypothetical protein
MIIEKKLSTKVVIDFFGALGVFAASTVLCKPVLSQVNTPSFEPSPSGACLMPEQNSFEERWNEDCYQDVQWERIPGSRTMIGGYDEGFAYIGINTIARNRESINFDFIASSGYIRFSGNCQTHVYAIIRATDTQPDLYNYMQANGVIKSAFSMACSL